MRADLDWPKSVTHWILCGVLGCWCLGFADEAQQTGQPADSLAPKDVEFFEKQVRPILVEHCLECHSAQKTQGGLRLDSRPGWVRGGDSGPAIKPGDLDGSLLIQAIRYGGDFEMPPKGKLPEPLIKQLEAWVQRGAPDPRREESAERRPAVDLEQARAHWAYRPFLPVHIPTPRDGAWARTPVDAFILQKLEASQLRPAAEASRAVLARRLYLDLTGLSPSPEELDAFVRDDSPGSYERLVDRLLGSPRYGERWGRIWLDVARFAESTTLRGFVFPEAWRYRDYVIQAWNEDLPFDQFVREQIAGDLLPTNDPAERERRLVATSYLVLGNTNLEEQDKDQLDMDVIDEQLDVIGKGLLAQTLTCARCHDHKFDPVPQRDYYALAGILRNIQVLEHSNVSKWVEAPLPVSSEEERKFRDFDQAVAQLEQQIAAAKKSTATGKVAVSEEAVSPSSLPGIVIDDRQAKKVGTWEESQFVKRYIGEGYIHDMHEGVGQKSLTFVPELPADGVYEVRFAYTASENRAKAVPITVFSAEGEKLIHIDQTIVPPLDGLFVSLGQFRFEKAGQSFVLISNDDPSGHVIADAVQFLPVTNPGATAAAPAATTSNDVAARVVPGSSPSADSDKEAEKRELAALEKRLKQLKADAPYRPATMAVRERPQITNAKINIRGVARNLGDEVPRGFLQICSAATAIPVPADQSGRVQLAEWLTSSQNPLPARVLANRIWQALFGAGLVRSVDNFGLTGDPPSHPELLDYLATRLSADGWSVKSAVRELVLSSTYRQASQVAADTRRTNEAIDLENRLLWRMNRRRLTAEMIRDSMLATAGSLSLETGGPGFPRTLAADYGFEQKGLRRSIYEPVFRNSLPELFEVFDFADVSLVTGKRSNSTVAPQALFLLNNPFVWEQSRRAAEQLLKTPERDDAARIRTAFVATFGREPTEREAAAAIAFVTVPETAPDREPTKRQRWTQFCQSLFAAIEFRYVE